MGRHCETACPPPGDLPDPGIEPVSLESHALRGRFFTTMPPGKPHLRDIATNTTHGLCLDPISNDEIFF